MAKVEGAKVQRLPYPLEGESLSKKDNAKNPAEIREANKTPYRTLIGMLSYIMGHTGKKQKNKNAFGCAILQIKRIQKNLLEKIKRNEAK